MAKTKTNLRSVEHSSETEPNEISLDDIAKLARDVDQMIKDDPDEKPKRGRKTVAKPNGKAPIDGAETGPQPLPPDPEFEMMLTWGSSFAVDAAVTNWHWSEPGVHWRNKVGACIARLVQRITPMHPGPLADLVTLTGYVALWAVPNVAANRETPGKDIVRDNGERKDV